MALEEVRPDHIIRYQTREHWAWGCLRIQSKPRVLTPDVQRLAGVRQLSLPEQLAFEPDSKNLQAVPPTTAQSLGWSYFPRAELLPAPTVLDFRCSERRAFVVLHGRPGHQGLKCFGKKEDGTPCTSTDFHSPDSWLENRVVCDTPDQFLLVGFRLKCKDKHCKSECLWYCRCWRACKSPERLPSQVPLRTSSEPCAWLCRFFP